MDLRQLIIFDDFFFDDKRKISRILEFRGFDPHTVPNFETLEKPVLNEYQWPSQVRERFQVRGLAQDVFLRGGEERCNSREKRDENHLDSKYIIS